MPQKTFQNFQTPRICRHTCIFISILHSLYCSTVIVKCNVLISWISISCIQSNQIRLGEMKPDKYFVQFSPANPSSFHSNVLSLSPKNVHHLQTFQRTSTQIEFYVMYVQPLAWMVRKMNLLEPRALPCLSPAIIFQKQHDIPQKQPASQPDCYSSGLAWPDHREVCEWRTKKMRRDYSVL